ncbi:MAG TPA: hypothetical protein VGA13_06750 [Acidimicrobiales bacterium]
MNPSTAHRRSRLLGVVLALSLVAAACGSDSDDDAGTPGDGELVGLFEIAAGECTGAEVAGTWFRMVQSGGTVADGPFVPNSDSTCTDDPTITPLAPGSDGGLLAGSYQPLTDPAFDEGGSALVSSIVQPTTWFAVGFGVSTNETDAQTNDTVSPPAVSVDDAGILSGDLRAIAASWNGQHFNQGSPKPDGSLPGATTEPTGTYDAGSGAYTLEWTSQIEGGPFDGFVGVWHLEGTFTPA